MLELYGPMTSVGNPVFMRLGNHTRGQWGVYPALDGWAGVFCLERQIPACSSSSTIPSWPSRASPIRCSASSRRTTSRSR